MQLSKKVLVILPKTHTTSLSFPDNKLLASLVGENDSFIKKIETKFHADIAYRGNVISVSARKSDIPLVQHVLHDLYQQLQQGKKLSLADIEAAIRMAKTSHIGACYEDIIIKTPKLSITPRSPNQHHYIKTLWDKELVFATGPAGTGKTYLAVAAAVSMLAQHQVERLILARPVIEAGEKLGFLPGDLKEKLDPYMQPLYDALYDMLGAQLVQRYITQRIIEIAPLAFMRGRTLKNCYIILDEAQNATCAQMKMFLTRLGTHARMVIAGDLSQTDLPDSTMSGLKDAMIRLQDIADIGFVKLENTDIIRHDLVSEIVDAYHTK